MLSFNDFVKVFDAYGKYVSQAPKPPQPPQAPQAPQPPQPPQAPQAPQPPDDIAQMLTQMQAQLNQMQTPAPTISDVKPLSVDDVIAKIFE
jgi:hypothetical protein